MDDDIINALYAALPANNRAEIAQRMTAAMQRHFSTAHVSVALLYVRCHAEELGWIVPHARRGRGITTEGDKFFAVSMEPDGSFSPSQRLPLREGLEGTLSYATRLTTNAAAALQACAAQLRKSALREELEDWADLISFSNHRAKKLLRTVRRKSA